MNLVRNHLTLSQHRFLVSIFLKEPLTRKTLPPVWRQSPSSFVWSSPQLCGDFPDLPTWFPEAGRPALFYTDVSPVALKDPRDPRDLRGESASSSYFQDHSKTPLPSHSS